MKELLLEKIEYLNGEERWMLTDEENFFGIYKTEKEAREDARICYPEYTVKS